MFFTAPTCPETPTAAAWGLPYRKNKNEEIDGGRLKITPAARRVYVEDREITLANKEYELLLFFDSNPEIVMSRERLPGKIRGEDSFGDLNTVAVHINRLREKIEQDPSKPRHIQTMWSAGYRFMKQAEAGVSEQPYDSPRAAGSRSFAAAKLRGRRDPRGTAKGESRAGRRGFRPRKG
jgi:DNA-binding winged helix-turn-helix (wHTH) protein